mmetsp:Transcript_29699/g.66611  ORF Transcript_29699/g.66611 Transcript_29699/m.66611 type:complete len:268 (-) Transcript_29699:7-810(-)
MVAQLPAVVGDAAAVRAVLHETDAVLLADGHHAIHVAHLSAHVRKHHDGGTRLFGLDLEVVEVHGPVGFGLDEDGLRVEAHDSRGQGREGEAIGDHLVSRLDAHRHEAEKDRRRARVHAHRVFLINHLGEFLFGVGDLRRLRRRRAVPEEAARAHHLHGRLDALLRDGHGLREVASELGRSLHSIIEIGHLLDRGGVAHGRDLFEQGRCRPFSEAENGRRNFSKCRADRESGRWRGAERDGDECTPVELHVLGDYWLLCGGSRCFGF